jgi:predicted membrane protein
MTRPVVTIGQLSALAEGVEEHKKMPLVNLVIALIVVGVVLYMINRYIPMASSIKTILNVVVVVSVGIWVLQAVGLWGGISSFRVGP